jgi:hypothetical protein
VYREYPAATIPERIRALLRAAPPSPDELGYDVDELSFASSHFGDHPDLLGTSLLIPNKWDDPAAALRTEAKVILDAFIRPRPYFVQEVNDRF